MWGGIIGLIIQLISGAVGGNVAGAAMKQYSFGTVGNSIVGLIGGGAGAQIIGALVGGGGTGATWLERVVSISARLSVRSPPAVLEEAS
jgi:uncharacterized membrane protein YeaQ/YmgE (transglycosylase-associated protein family)